MPLAPNSGRGIVVKYKAICRRKVVAEFPQNVPDRTLPEPMYVDQLSRENFGRVSDSLGRFEVQHDKVWENAGVTEDFGCCHAGFESR